MCIWTELSLVLPDPLLADPYPIKNSIKNVLNCCNGIGSVTQHVTFPISFINIWYLQAQFYLFIVISIKLSLTPYLPTSPISIPVNSPKIAFKYRLLHRYFHYNLNGVCHTYNNSVGQKNQKCKSDLFYGWTLPYT